MQDSFTFKCKMLRNWMMRFECKVQGDNFGGSQRTRKSMCMKRANFCQEHFGRGLPFYVVAARVINGPWTDLILKACRSRKWGERKRRGGVA